MRLIDNRIRELSCIAGNNQGATAIEYGLIVSLIALMIVISLSLVGNDLITVFDSVHVGIEGTERCNEVGSNCDK